MGDSQHPAQHKSGGQLKAWILPKFDRLPRSLAELLDAKVLSSPDFAEAYSNPLYYLRHDIHRHTPQCQLSFVHGDLNLHNILFNLDSAKAPDISLPLFIDFRHAALEQLAVTDLAKLEACLRYQGIGKISSVDFLQQVVIFLAGTRGSITIRNPPEALTDKTLQDLWRCIVPIRSAVSRVLADRPDADLAYWTTLLAYGVSSSTYAQLPLEVRHLAFLDAAALFTRYIESRDLSAGQRILRVHDQLSPPVFLEDEEKRNNFLPFLLRALERKQGILIIGPNYGRTSGFESLHHFVARIFHDLTGRPAPGVSTETLLDILGHRRPRYEIAGAIQERIRTWKETQDARDFASMDWAAVINWHFHDSPYRSLQEISATPRMHRIENYDQAIVGVDAAGEGALTYIPLLGDVLSAPDLLVLTQADRRERSRVVSIVAEALGHRQHPLSLVFWKCEDLKVDELLQLKSIFSEEATVPVDSFFVSDQDEPIRDQALEELDI